jgi:hypothetical protein
MKRILTTGAVAALALLGVAAPANAEPAGAACFGQVHKAVNDGFVPGVDNVGQLVKALGGGKAKNATADSLC